METEYAQRGSLGILNMREREEDIGGQQSVQSRPGDGTTIGLQADLSPMREALALAGL